MMGKLNKTYINLQPTFSISLLVSLPHGNGFHKPFLCSSTTLRLSFIIEFFVFGGGNALFIPLIFTCNSSSGYYQSSYSNVSGYYSPSTTISSFTDGSFNTRSYNFYSSAIYLLDSFLGESLSPSIDTFFAMWIVLLSLWIGGSVYFYFLIGYSLMGELRFNVYLFYTTGGLFSTFYAVSYDPANGPSCKNSLFRCYCLYSTCMLLGLDYFNTFSYCL